MIIKKQTGKQTEAESIQHTYQHKVKIKIQDCFGEEEKNKNK